MHYTVIPGFNRLIIPLSGAFSHVVDVLPEGTITTNNLFQASLVWFVSLYTIGITYLKHHRCKSLDNETNFIIQLEYRRYIQYI